MQRVCGSAIRASLRQAASSAPLVASRTAVALPALCQAATRSCRTSSSSSAVSARTEAAPPALSTETSRVSITPRVLTASTARTTLVSQDVVVQAKRGFRSATLGGAGSGSKFWPLLGAAAGVGLMGLVGYGAFTPSAERSAWQNQDQFTSSQRMNLAKIYGYTAAGLSVTAAAAAAMFSRGLHYRLMGMNPIALMLGGIALTVGTSMLTRMIPYENKVAKHVAWGAFNASVALALCPLGVVGGPLLLKAAATTGCVVGALTLTAAAAPSDTFLNMGGGLSVGLGCLIAASVGQMFFPASGLLYNAVLYGGTGLFGLLLLHDTQRAVAVARYVPPHRLDPINESIGIYMTIVNLFSRIATIMSNRRK